MIYTGIGSRKTPQLILAHMQYLGTEFGKAGLTLRSGGASGADNAFEAGCDAVQGDKEIFIPWAGFNGHYSPSHIVPKNLVRCASVASQYHPAWDKCSPGAKKLHARNVCQILGEDLESPTEMVLCWTKNGELVGGTAMAIRIALDNEIPIINFGNHHLLSDKEIYELCGYFIV